MKILFDILAENNITPNGLLVLHATYNNYSYKNYINFKAEQYRLQVTGFLLLQSDNTYKISKSGLHAIREAEKATKKISKNKVKAKIPFADWENKIKEYNDLFPKGKRENSSSSFRTNPKELFARFKWLFDEYPEYSWEMVLKATRTYVKHYKDENNFTYLQSSKYFIKKDDKTKTTTSNLATMCYNIAEGNEDQVDNGSFYFGP